jgi:hypothetical protein
MTDVTMLALFDLLTAINDGKKSTAPPDGKMFSVAHCCVGSTGRLG